MKLLLIIWHLKKKFKELIKFDSNKTFEFNLKSKRDIDFEDFSKLIENIKQNNFESNNFFNIKKIDLLKEEFRYCDWRTKKYISVNSSLKTSYDIISEEVERIEIDMTNNYIKRCENKNSIEKFNIFNNKTIERNYLFELDIKKNQYNEFYILATRAIKYFILLILNKEGEQIILKISKK